MSAGLQSIGPPPFVIGLNLAERSVVFPATCVVYNIWYLFILVNIEKMSSSFVLVGRFPQSLKVKNYIERFGWLKGQYYIRDEKEYICGDRC